MNLVAFIAFLVDVFGTFLCQVSYMLQKQAILSVEDSGLNGKSKKSPYCTKLYGAGFTLLILGTIVHASVLPFCDIVLLSTNTATGIIISSFLAIKYLGEKPVWKFDLPSVGLIIIGCLAIVSLSNYEDKTFTVDEITLLLSRPVTIAFLSFYVFAAACTYLFWQWFYKKALQFNTDTNDWVRA